ncbi:hypothetical protein OHB41_01350 [Streptomyces sp. NBC_01571]|uniref:hypothetical protein n=1 Tax=Streptomyces sp. NBC_01571 TaxID=2975883 RepID=UPI002257F81C|nr:hypothetical protein [Streptomyces sp. NBC_01571]MCX4571865.1 hypothetical protein [Streptomyces sp. NBC_01571]
MNESTPSEPTPEDGEPTSFAKSAKNLFKKHKAKILAVGTVGLVVAGVVASLAEGQDTEGSEPSPGLEDADRPKRRSPVGHEVVATLVKLAAGQQASEERRAAYKEVTGEDLPADSTYRSKHRRGDFGEDETPGEAAA